VRLAIVDLAYGNIGSITYALERLGVSPAVTRDAEEIAAADRVVLPGVGAAGHAMRRVERLGLRDCLRSLTQPALGICLGMQLLFKRSDENGAECLGLIACDTGPATVASANYGREIPAIVRQRNWLGAQFHPERSGDAGARFLEAFVR